jgi:hypothetical protein
VAASAGVDEWGGGEQRKERASMIRLLALAAVAAAFIVAAAGCGGSSSDSSTGATTTATSGNTDTNSSSTDTTGGTDTTSSTDTTDTTSSSGTSSGTLTKNCIDFASATAKLGEAIGAATGSGGGDTETLKSYFAGLADNAPSNVKDDFDTLATAVGKYIDALKKAGFKPGETPSAEDIQKLQAAVAPLSTPDVQQASQEIQAWVDGGCKS